MKFLCVECDVPMALSETKGPHNGSMTVLFGCRSCGRQIAMLTNEMETQMVHSLGVKIGGRKEAAPPMETISSSLIGYQTDSDADNASESHSEGDVAVESGTVTSSGGCPFSAMLAGSETDAVGEEESGNGHHQHLDHGHEKPAAVVELRWSAEARHRMERIPSFVRPMVEKGVEDYAKANDISLVDEDILQDVRSRFGF